MRALVTGGSGFVGRHLVRRLLDAGAVVHATDRDAASARLLDGRARFHPLDLADATGLNRLVYETSPTAVFHLAAKTSRDRGAALLPEMLQCNVLATAALIAALVEKTPAAALVVVGSAEDYGDAAGPWTEDLPALAVSPYGQSKRLAGELAVAAHGAWGLRASVVRPSVIYGPGQSGGQFIPSLVAACLAGERFAMTPGEQSRDFLFVDDVVDGLLAAAHPGAAGGVFNLCTGVQTRVVDLAERVRALVGRGVIDAGALPYRGREAMTQPLDGSRAARVLGFRAKTSLDEGLAATIAAAAIATPRRADE